ncbi:DUF2782 domain-containing protein [Beggiatoa leptomitoformis]|uniref:DUF2782 domain-containing protein n=1 Tax=Beggiatoa leptomitoformis TaxID=288004 RepID=A0A2N9YJM3_9GAMM|nr:DUF2782 domain-containing protein [Beggiatoa leptomitoformis]ALG69391.2 DUF2782 domain-containing protein [Beggiatoa leptomitoformis]AUI70680.2 DUF2782 domain-containing protein [Beggiatoa leptomitoformis]
MRKIYNFLVFICLSCSLQAEDSVPTPPNILATPTAPVEKTTQTTEEQPIERIEPEVTVIRKADKTIEEYRVNGQLTLIKVTPKVGVAYYLVDMDGDGTLETSRFALDNSPYLNQWILFSW